MSLLSARPLFGGAMTCAVPASFVDVSGFREVPDNQEVFADASASDSSLVVEILEQPTASLSSSSAAAAAASSSVSVPVPDADAVAYYLADLAEANDATDRSTFHSSRRLAEDEMPQLAAHTPRGAGCSAWVGAGTQAVSKGREGDAARNVVRIYAAVLRLPAITTDVLVTMNVPMVISAASSSAASGAVGALQCGGGGDGAEGKRAEEEDPWRAPSFALFLSVVKSLRIEDWGLFGE